MVIASRAVGDVIIFDPDGEFTRDGCPRPSLHELVEAALVTGENKTLDVYPSEEAALASFVKS
jgi:hypothetical protein